MALLGERARLKLMDKRNSCTYAECARAEFSGVFLEVSQIADGGNFSIRMHEAFLIRMRGLINAGFLPVVEQVGSHLDI